MCTLQSFVLVTPFSYLTVLFWKMEFICGCSKLTNLTSQLLKKIKYFGTSRLFESKLLVRAASIAGCNILLGLLDPEDGRTTLSKFLYLLLYDNA
jgi:hypothetical protein